MVSSLVRGVVVLAGCCCAALLADVRAQVGQAERAAHMAGLRIDRSMLAGPLATSPQSAMRISGTSDYAHLEMREVNLVGSGVVLEMPRAAPDGTYQRPRLLIGRQSPELRMWMKEAGLVPERCMLPMFRSRLKRDPESGKLSAAVLMSARCTFY
jgi:hypothetical protein